MSDSPSPRLEPGAIAWISTERSLPNQRSAATAGDDAGSGGQLEGIIVKPGYLDWLVDKA